MYPAFHFDSPDEHSQIHNNMKYEGAHANKKKRRKIACFVQFNAARIVQLALLSGILCRTNGLSFCNTHSSCTDVSRNIHRRQSFSCMYRPRCSFSSRRRLPTIRRGLLDENDVEGILYDEEDIPYSLLDEDDGECSIDNLDACIKSINSKDILYDEEDILYSLIDDDDGECSIDNLDACIQDPQSIACKIEELSACIDEEDPECSIDNLEACAVKENKNASSDQSLRSLKSFLADPVVEVQLALLVIVSSFIVGIGTIHPIPPLISSFSEKAEIFISVIFTLEYIARWKINNFSAKYVFEPLAIIDLLSILPSLIKFASILGMVTPTTVLGGAIINLRLLRILRLQRVLVDYDTFQKFELALGLEASNTRPYQLQLARLVISIFTYLSVTSGLMYSAEHVVNPDIPDYFTSLYFCIITLTTVGFGDIHPITTAGRWIISGSIIFASAVVPAQAAALIEALLDREGEQNQNNDAKTSDVQQSLKDDNFIVADSTVDNISARMDNIEDKLDETNERLDKLLKVLEAREEKVIPS